MRRLYLTMCIWMLAGLVLGQSVSDSLLQNGRLYYERGDYGTAISYYRNYLKIAQADHNDRNIADAYRLIGDAFRASGAMQSALEELDMGLQIATQAADSNMIARIYNRIASVRFEMEDTTACEIAANHALQIARSVNDQATVSSTLNILGANYRSTKRYQLALDALAQSVEIQRALGDTTDIPNALNNMANTQIVLGRYEEAIATGLQSYKMATAMKIIVYQHYAAFMLYKAYRATENFPQAFDWMEIYNGLTQALLDEAKGQEISKLREEMAMAKSELENEQLRIQNALQSETIASQNTKTFAIASIAISVLILAIVLLLVARRQRKNNAALKFKNSQILEQSTQISAINSQMQAVALARESQQAKLIELDSVKNKLFSIISHDLRSPMTSIQGLLQLMEGGLVTEQQLSQMAGRLKVRVDNTTMLLDNLLNWSHSQMEGFSPACEPIDIADLVTAECINHEAAAKAKNIGLSNEVAPEMFAMGDRAMIALVLRNLISNAIKFTQDHGHVHISAAQVGTRLHLAVADTGIGIPAEHISKVLGSDYFSTDGTAHERGSGLGLRLCKEFLDKNNGEIWLVANAGPGTTFWFSLPQGLGNPSVPSGEKSRNIPQPTGAS